MKKLIHLVLLTLSFQATAAVDCKMFMTQKDRVVISKKRSCVLTSDQSRVPLTAVDVCIARMKTHRGLEILRIVLEGKKGRSQIKEVVIVEKLFKELNTEGSSYSFKQEYFNPSTLRKTKYEVVVDKNFDSIELRSSQGITGLRPLYDLNLDCR